MRLQRITTASRWIPEIDGLRFVAIASVLLTHVFAQMVNRGGYSKVFEAEHSVLISHMYLLGRGVQVFFVISGFILAQPFIRSYQDNGKPVGLKAFYLRRLTRLEPPYILALLLYAASFILFRHLDAHFVGLSMLTSVVYVNNFFHSLPPVDFVTWSLEVEVMFYLLAPLLSLVFAIPGRGVRTVVLVTAIVTTAGLPWAAATHVGFLFPAQLCYFLVGYLLADLRIHVRPQFSNALWDVVSLIVWPTLFLIPENRWTPLLLCVLLVTCFCATMFGPFTRRLVGVPWVAHFGGMCYSTYLLHMLVISSLFPLTRRLLSGSHIYLSYLSQLMLLVPPVMVASVLYFIVIERPCMDPRWPHKLLARMGLGSELAPEKAP